jgi:hypothetical protein
VTVAPLALVAGLTVPPPGLVLQLTGLASLVVAESCSCCARMRPAWVTDRLTALGDVGVAGADAGRVAAEGSWTWEEAPEPPQPART